MLKLGGRIRRQLCVSLLALATSSPCAQAAEGDSITQCDADKSGLIEDGELNNCLLRIRNPSFSALDADKDGVIEPTEVEEYLIFDRTDLEDLTGHGPPYSLMEVREYLAPERKISLGGLLVRRSHETLTFTNKGKGFSKAEGALISYSRNELEDSWSLLLKGAVMGLYRLDEKDRGPEWLSALGLAPSLSFDRLETKTSEEDDEKEDEVDSLTGRLGLLLETEGDALDLQTFQLALFYATDFDLDSRVIGAEFDWSPTRLDWGMGVFRTVGGEGSPLQIRWRFTGEAELGRVEDVGEKENLVEDDEFIRVGGKLVVEVRPTLSELVVGKISYSYLEGVEGEPNQVELFTAGVTVKFEPTGHFTLEGLYQNGQLPLTLDEAETLSVGLGVKF